jgi:2-polyprenyl-6-methoxyphenol hydroxylase-like FAD-dependent oxidoreductase
LIVGAGPAGASLACFLGSYGLTLSNSVHTTPAKQL